MEMDKVFLVKVKNSETKYNIITSGINQLVDEYDVSDFGEIDSFHYSDFFDNKKSFWFLVDNEIDGFNLLKILCDEFLTPIICLYNNRYYAFDSFGESITIPENCGNNYALVAMYVEGITGEDFDSYLYGKNFENFLGDNLNNNEDELDFSDFLIEEDKEEKYKRNYKEPSSEYFLEKCEQHGHKHQSINSCSNSKDVKENKTTKVLKFKEPVVINNFDDFLKESSEYSYEKSEIKESAKFEVANYSSNLNDEFKSADSNYEKEKNNFKKIKLNEEEINVEELSSLLNSLDEALLEDSDKQKGVGDNMSIDMSKEKVFEEKDLDDNGIEISQEELDEIIKNYEQQDEYFKKQKNIDEEFEKADPYIKPNFFDDINSLEINDKKNKDENFEYSKVDKVEDADLSYLDSSSNLKNKIDSSETLDDIKDGLLNLEEFENSNWHLPDEDIPVLFNKINETDILNLEDIKEDMLEMENFNMNKKTNLTDFEKNERLLEKENVEDFKCNCICDDECKCECGCNIDDCKCNLNGSKCEDCKCNLDETKCECGCNVCDCKCNLDGSKCEDCKCNLDETKCECGCNVCDCKCNLDETKCEDCKCNLDSCECECGDLCDCKCNLDTCDECKFESSCDIDDCQCIGKDFTCSSKTSNELDENKVCEFECCNFDDTNKWDDEYTKSDANENKYEALFKDVIEMENSETNSSDFIFETKETENDLDFDNCICDFEDSKQAENQCVENCTRSENEKIDDDFENKTNDYCEVCQDLKNKETVVESYDFSENLETNKENIESKVDDYCEVCENLQNKETIVENYDFSENLETNKENIENKIDDYHEIFEDLENKEVIVENVAEEEKWDPTNINLTSINDFDLDKEEAASEDLFFNEITKDEVNDDTKQIDDFYVPFQLKDEDVLMNVELDNKILESKPELEEIKLVDDFVVEPKDDGLKLGKDKDLIVDEDLGLMLSNILEKNKENLIVDDSLELDLSSSSDSQENLFDIDSIEMIEPVEDKKAFDDSLDTNLGFKNEKNVFDFDNSEDLPYVKIDSVANAMLGSLNEAKNSIESNKNLVDELQRFLEELNIERKKLSEKKLLIAKRNEEAKRLFASNYGKDYFKSVK